MKQYYFSILTILALSFTSQIFANAMGDNDTCVGAIDLNCNDSITGTTADNTDTGGNPAPDEFYKYTGDGDLEEITISLCSDITDYDSFLRVFTDCTLTNQVAANDDSCGLQSEVSFLSEGTTTYYIMVEGFNAISGNFQLEISCVSGLTNDSCTFATPIACGDTVVGETTNDTDSGFNESPDEFFIFTGDGFEQEVTVTMCDGGTNYDSFLRVFSACDLNNQIVNNDDSCGLQSEVAFTSDGTSSYIIMVEGFAGFSGDFSLSISCSGPPMPPPNDLIENSILIDEAGGFPYTDPEVSSTDATPEIGVTMNCDLTGIDGVWYHFTPDENISVSGIIETPAGIRAVIFFKAPSENATIDQLSRVEQEDNPCFTGETASITAMAGQTYYAFAANKGANTSFSFETSVLGISNTVFKDFTFYPNPTQNQLYLEATSTIEQIEITNVLGQTVSKQIINNQSTDFDVSNLNAGTYFLKATIEGSTNTYQFIKQ